jgi:hypothetical protein
MGPCYTWGFFSVLCFDFDIVVIKDIIGMWLMGYRASSVKHQASS